MPIKIKLRNPSYLNNRSYSRCLINFHLSLFAITSLTHGLMLKNLYIFTLHSRNTNFLMDIFSPKGKSISHNFHKMGEQISIAQSEKFIDIAVNLCDQMYKGIYNGKSKHPQDIANVLNRTYNSGVHRLILLAGNLEESEEALNLSKKYEIPGYPLLMVAMGVHPTRCLEFEGKSESYEQKLFNLIENNFNKIAAYGEIGLDYDRLQFCPKEIQKKYFKSQLDVAKHFQLPIILHMRNACEDFLEILKGYLPIRGVVHSFTGTLEELLLITKLNLYISVNGCSLKSQENLTVIKQIPIDRLILETDSPYCGIRPSHASHWYLASAPKKSLKAEKWDSDCLVMGRNEPCNIWQVAEVVYKVQEIEIPFNEFCQKILNNTKQLFGIN